MNSVCKGIILATTAASLIFSAGFVIAADESSKKPGRCFGINSCRGKAACGTKNVNACAGRNSCKGRCWLFVNTENECISQGGQILK
jgi:hypothetical protein